MQTAEQKQLDQLAELDGQTGTCSELTRAVRDLGFETRDLYPNAGDIQIVLTGVWLPDGNDVIAGRIVPQSDGDYRIKI